MSATKQPRLLILWIAVWRRAFRIRATVCRLFIDINLWLAHGIPHGFNALVGLFANDHFLNFAGALFDDGLLVSFCHLELAFAQRVEAAWHFTGCRAPFDDNALVPEGHMRFGRRLDDISANAITALGCPFADRQLLFHHGDDLLRRLGCPPRVRSASDRRRAVSLG